MEIKPQPITPEYSAPTYTPCGPWITSYDRNNPWQVVWNSISFAPDPYQQMFNFQANRYGPGLQRRTYKFDPEKTYNITLIQSNEYAYFTYGGFYDHTTGSWIPIQYVGTELTGVIGSDLGATSIYDYTQDYPNGLYNNESKYRLRIKRDVPSGTEIIMSVYDGMETINYHTRVEVPTFSIGSITDEDTLLHYYSREVEFILNFQQSCQLDGYGGAYPTGIKFNVDIIQGQEYGNLYYPGTVADPEQSGTSIINLEDEYGQSISNYTIKFRADGVQPDEQNPGIVTIRCSANDMDIAPVEISFPVKYNTDPPDEGGSIVVEFDKENYKPGETAVANCKWLTGYDELIDFPIDQRFSVEITGGSEYGVLQDAETGVVSNILEDVSNGFRVITAAEIAEEEARIILKVRTTVGGGIPTRALKQNDLEAEERNNRGENNTITPELLVIGGEEIIGYGTVLVKKDECDEEIIVCNNPQPQTFNPLWIEKYKNYSYFDPEPKNPQSLKYIVSGCQLKKNGNVQGLTFIIPGIPLSKTANQNYFWRPQDNAIIKVCLDENEKRWLIRFEELRIAIFSSDCIEGLVDLGNGSNISLLESNITSMKDYRIVIDDIKSWRNQYPVDPKKYAFNSGIIKHEYKHFLIDSIYVINSFNNLFNNIFNSNEWFLDKNTFTCPKEVLSAKEFLLRDNIIQVVNNCFTRYKNLSETEKEQEEIECVKFAQDEYDLIKIRIQGWAVNQPWFKP